MCIGEFCISDTRVNLTATKSNVSLCPDDHHIVFRCSIINANLLRWIINGQLVDSFIASDVVGPSRHGSLPQGITVYLDSLSSAGGKTNFTSTLSASLSAIHNGDEIRCGDTQNSATCTPMFDLPRGMKYKQCMVLDCKVLQ